MITKFKIFEKYNIDTIKKYIVWHEYDLNETKNIVSILIVYDNTNISLLKVKSKYEYNMVKQKSQTPEIRHYQYIDLLEDMEYLIFTSDSLKECEEFLNIYVSSKKYNI